MKTTELRNLSQDELADHLLKLEHELTSLRQGIRQGTQGNHARLGQLRREVARVKTVMHQVIA